MSELTYAEDITVGITNDLGTYELTKQTLLEFSRLWDPLPMHTDEELAKSSGFGRLIASGIQSIGIAQRLLAQVLYPGWAIFAGRGLQDVRFLKPVSAGDVLHGYAVISDVDYNRPERALVTISVWLEVEGAKVLQFGAQFYVLRRTSA